jgi:DNA replication protein DnaC
MAPGSSSRSARTANLKGSLLVTTNLEFAWWVEVFGDERLTGALLDQFTHHCYILEFNGDSYRFKESL